MSKNVRRVDRETAAKLAMVMYVGELCRFCGHEYTSIEDLRERGVVWAHYPTEPPITGKGQSIACAVCFTRVYSNK